MDNKPKKGYGYIYKYTSPSGKSYIGQTVYSLDRRAGHNGKGYLGCSLFYKAIKKYGFNNFDRTILATVPKDKLNEEEKKYIHLFNTLAPNGYNLNEGGKIAAKSVYQYDLNGNFLREWPRGQSQAAKGIGIGVMTINDCLNGIIKTAGGYFWSYEKLKKYPINLPIISNKEKIIKMLSCDGELIKTFPSLAKAAEYVQGERSAIRRVCRGELKTHRGYKWECAEILKEKKYNNTAKQILKIDPQTNKIIHVYPSISRAAAELGKGTCLIRRVLDHETRTAYGFRWKTAQGSTTTDL